MEGFMNFFAYAGIFSLYIVITAIVTRATISISKATKEDDGAIALAVIAGVFWPVAVPFGILIYWMWAITGSILGKAIPNMNDTKKEECEELVKVKKKVKVLEKTVTPKTISKPKTKFKVGDLITGVKGNPDNYKHLYEGCVCRVLSVNGSKAMKVILVDHVDKTAHKLAMGKTFKAPVRNFILIKTKKK